MKKSILLLVVISLISFACSSTKLHTENYRGHKILVGKGTKNDLLKSPYNQWFNSNYKNYVIDNNVIAKLKPVINDYDFKVLMGTWCPDSRAQTPVFYKVLEQAGYNKNVEISFLPRKFKNYELARPYQLSRVPTIIVYRNKKEIGRIVESPTETIEKDLYQIIKRK